MRAQQGVAALRPRPSYFFKGRFHACVSKSLHFKSVVFQNLRNLVEEYVMLYQSFWWRTGLTVFLAGSVWCGTFGKVVPIGGQASDVVLDESRGVLYIANFTANRIEVMSLADTSIQTSINVAAQPSSMALSPDSRYLVITHFGNLASPSPPNNS